MWIRLGLLPVAFIDCDASFNHERPNNELQRTRPGFAWSVAAELSVRRTRGE